MSISVPGSTSTSPIPPSRPSFQSDLSDGALRTSAPLMPSNSGGSHPSQDGADVYGTPTGNGDLHLQGGASPDATSSDLHVGTSTSLSGHGQGQGQGQGQNYGHGPASASISPVGSSSGGFGQQQPPMAQRKFSEAGSFAGSHMDPGLAAVLEAQGGDEVVPTTFDESMLRQLCDLDCGMPLLLDRVKQNMSSCREASIFFKKRAAIEEEYGRALSKLVQTSTNSYSNLGSESKAGTFVTAYQSFLRTHEIIADNRIRFGQLLSEMADEMSQLVKELDKQRKQSKDNGSRLERALLDSEVASDKARVRFDQTAEELERVLVLKSGESVKDSSNLTYHNTLAATGGPNAAAAGGGGGGGGKRTFGKAMSKFKTKMPSQLAKQEEDVRNRMGVAGTAYSKQVGETQQLRQEWFNLQLPRILRALKEAADEIDIGTQYHLSRYAFLYEHVLVQDGVTVAPIGLEDGPGLKATVESIDNREDFKTFLQNYVVAYGMSGNKGPKREGPPEDGFAPIRSASIDNTLHSAGGASLVGAPTFGVDLQEQMARDEVDVPRVLEKCAEVIEAHGLETQGIYRLSGTTSRVQRLKAKLDRDVEAVDLSSKENLQDINDITGVLKLWFRELPEPLLTFDLYGGFIEAARVENPRLRHIRIHERVNELPDANYATLKCLMGHLDKVLKRSEVNSMGASNIAIVFGPNLLWPQGGQAAFQDMAMQCRAVETILEHYSEIFVENEEEGQGDSGQQQQQQQQQ